MGALDDWIARARAISVRAELERRGLWSKSLAGDRGAPCPACGGTDRFAVNLRKNVWICRASSAGGDAIALAQHLDGSDFLAACGSVLGEPRPDGRTLSEAERAGFAARAERRRREEEKRRVDAAASQARFRKRDRRAAHDLWSKTFPAAGTPAEAYLALRGLTAPPSARLRYEPDAPLSHPVSYRAARSLAQALPSALALPWAARRLPQAVQPVSPSREALPPCPVAPQPFGAALPPPEGPQRPTAWLRSASRVRRALPPVSVALPAPQGDCQDFRVRAAC